MPAQAAVSGMAASIRNAVESETFDLAGQTPATIERMVSDAFSSPLPIGEMIRITLVTGAGKLERQKYDEGAAKAVTGALRALGFEEDRGASAIPECAGSFKMQHDTGKNLKTVVVFPRILAEGDGAATGLEGKLGAMGVNGSSTALLREGSPEHKIAMASSAVFERMVGSMCPSWSQKKACVAAIDDVRQRLQGVEQKLLHGTPLDDAEQAFYDAVSATSLDEKATKVKDLMHKQVDEGKVTADERLQLLTQVKERIQSLTEEIEAAEKGGKPKRVEALTANKGKAQDRKKKLEGIVAQPPHPLKNEAEIAKLRREVEPLLEVEDGAKGRLLTLKESQAIAKKDDILEAIHQLEESSRGWFETDEAFRERVAASQRAWESRRKLAKKKAAAKPSASSAGPSLPSASKWATPSSVAKKKAAPKAAKPSSGGGVFQAMMMDSDSD